MAVSGPVAGFSSMTPAPLVFGPIPPEGVEDAAGTKERNRRRGNRAADTFLVVRKVVDLS